MRQFDSISNAQTNNPERLNPFIERAHERATKILRENAISLDEFKGFYDADKLARDSERVRVKESRFDHDISMKHHSDVLEAVIFDQACGGEWFGKEARAIKTSFFDDYFHGADIILELEDTARTLAHLSLSIDITFGTSTEEDKMADIKKNIDKGTLGRIDYFKSGRSQIRGEVSNVPQVVIGVERSTVIELARLWMEQQENPGVTNSLGEHPVKRLILSEILLQLHTFRNYAKENGHTNIVHIYEKDIQILEDIIRKQGVIDIGLLRNDKVFVAIRESLKIFKTAR